MNSGNNNISIVGIDEHTVEIWVGNTPLMYGVSKEYAEDLVARVEEENSKEWYEDLV